MDSDWLELISWLAECSEHPRERDDKLHSTPWIAPFILKNGATTRQLTDIDRIAPFIALDIDQPGWTLQGIHTILCPFDYVVYSTTNSTNEHQRWRIIVRMDREYSADEYLYVWHSFNQMFSESVDNSTKNANRISYIPGKWNGANHVFLSNRGCVVPVDDCVHYIKQVGILIVQPILSPLVVQIGTVPPPDHIPILTKYDETKFRTSEPGGRFFRMMCRAAARFRQNNWLLSAHDLAAAALAVSPKDRHGPRRNPVQEASRALRWADENVTPKSKWQLAREHLANKTKKHYI